MTRRGPLRGLDRNAIGKLRLGRRVKGYRLVAVIPTAPVAGRDQKVECGYDHVGRRVEKRVYNWTGSAWQEAPALRRRFVWSGWLLLLELDQNNAAIRKYVWGLDLAGQAGGQTSGLSALESAGGIGGLLALEDLDPGTSQTGGFLYLYDANGNVGQLLDADDGTVAVKYQYDPYGARASLPLPGELNQPFRFSTKYLDDQTGLYYFGYRYYSPKLARWLSRDPIGERGGLNVYASFQNDPSSYVDPNGRNILQLLSALRWTSADTSEACCTYNEYHDLAAGETSTSWTSSCQKTESCPATAKTPAECCACACFKSGWGLGVSWTTDRRLATASWGSCCWCTVYYSRADKDLGRTWYGLKRPRDWNHAVLSMKCDNGLTLIADHAMDGGPYHWSWVEGWDETPAHGRGEGIPPSDFGFVISTVRVSCETGRALVKWVQKTDEDDISYNCIQDCHWFARSGLAFAASGVTECQ